MHPIWKWLLKEDLKFKMSLSNRRLKENKIQPVEDIVLAHAGLGIPS